MLSIRPEQLHALTAPAREAFLARMLPHVKRYHPRQAAELGDDGVRDAIRAAVAAADRYGMRIEYDISRFIDLWFALGFDFDVSPRHPWAAPLLAESRLTPSQRMDRLFELALQYLDMRAAARAKRGV
jgi:hypothetical protein